MSNSGGKRRSFSDQATRSAHGGLCREPECLNLAARDGRCWGHVRQIQRHGQTRTLGAERPKMTALQRLRKAAIDFADAPAEDEPAFARADDNLRKAAAGYTKRKKGRG